MCASVGLEFVFHGCCGSVSSRIESLKSKGGKEWELYFLDYRRSAVGFPCAGLEL